MVQCQYDIFLLEATWLWTTTWRLVYGENLVNPDSSRSYNTDKHTCKKRNTHNTHTVIPGNTRTNTTCTAHVNLHVNKLSHMCCGPSLLSLSTNWPFPTFKTSDFIIAQIKSSRFHTCKFIFSTDKPWENVNCGCCTNSIYHLGGDVHYVVFVHHYLRNAPDTCSTWEAPRKKCCMSW